MMRKMVFTLNWLPTGVSMIYALLTGVIMSLSVLCLYSSDHLFGGGRFWTWFRTHWPYTQQAWGYVFLLPTVIGIAGGVVPRTWWRFRLRCTAVLSVIHALLAGVIWHDSPYTLLSCCLSFNAILGVWCILADGTVKLEIVERRYDWN